MKRERVRTRRRSFGMFILGWLTGFICTLGMLVGAGYWAYTSISVKKIEKWTKSEITDNEGLENMTIEKAVGIIQGITKNDANAYTLAKMEEDFGVKILGDSIYGISTDTIKNSPIKDLKQAFTDTVDSATFNNVLSFMDIESGSLGLLDNVLETQVTYYVKDDNLYTKDVYEDSNKVDFKYTIEHDEHGNPVRVKFANGTHTITSGIIKPRLRDLPLNTAMTSITDVTNDLKIYEVMDYHYDVVTEKYYENYNESTGVYSGEVSGIMANLAQYSVSDLSKSDTFNGIYIYEVMGYTRTGTEPNYIYMDGADEVTGVLKTLAGKTIGELSDVDTFNDMYIYEVMGYTRTGTAPNYTYMDGANEVTGVMKSLAGKTISELSNEDTFNNMYIYEVMGYTRTGTAPNYTYMDGANEVTGVMKSLAGKTISELSSDDTFNNMYVYEVLDYHYNSSDKKYYQDYDGTNYSNPVTGVISHIVSSKVSELSSTINTLTVGKILDIEEADATGIIKALYGTSVENLESKINSLTLGEALGIEEADATGIIKALYTTPVNNLESKISDLTLGEALGIEEADATGIIKALYTTPVNNLESKINDLTLGEALGIEKAAATGVVKALFDKKVNDLDTEINNLEIYQVMGYTRTGTAPNYTYKDGEDEVTGIMGAIAGSKVNEIGNTIDTLKAKDVFDAETTTILKLFTTDELNTLTIMDLPSKVTDKINTVTIDYLVANGVITGVDTTTPYYQGIKGFTLVQLLNGSGS